MSFSHAVQDLSPKLSSAAKITFLEDSSYADVAARWSDYKAPKPGLVVTVASESDIENTVQWAVSHKVKFLAQGGGHGFTTTYNIGPSDVLINLCGLCKVIVDAEEGTAIIEAGASNGAVIMEAHKAKTHIVVGNCDSTGAIGLTLGAGLSRLQGNYGLAIDNLISARIVTAQGKAITVSETENADLWWAIRGAGHSFGIVSSIKVKAHPEINQGQHWQHLLAFTPDKLEAVTEAINALDFKAGMSIHYIFGCFPPDFNPGIALALWYGGDERAARSAFASLFALSPALAHGGMIPYSAINADSAAFNFKGGRKPMWACGLSKMSSVAMREGWELYADFVGKNEGAKMSWCAVECYAWGKPREGEADGEAEGAFPWRRAADFWAICNTIYTDPEFDAAAVAFGEAYRAVMRKYSDHPEGPHPMYVNFAIGDEKPEELYGDEKRLSRLRALKAKWDPEGYFNCYNPFIRDTGSGTGIDERAFGN